MPVPRGAGMSCDGVLESSEAHHGGSCHDTRADRDVTHSNSYGTAFSIQLCRERVRFTKICSPVPTTDREDIQLCDDNGGADGSGHFL